MGDYAKKKASPASTQEPPPLIQRPPQTAADIIPEDKTVKEEGKTGDTEVSFTTQMLTKMGSPEQIRRFLIQKYGPRGVWGASSGRWFVRSTDSQGKFTSWTEATPDDLSLASAAASALPMAGGTIGGALAAPAAVATGNPALESAGVALGTGAGEEANRLVTEATMGPRDESLTQHALETATSMGAGYLGSELPRAAGMAFRAGAKAFEGTKIGAKVLAPFASDVDLPLVGAAREMGMTLSPGEASTAAPIKQISQFLRGAIGASTEFAKMEAPRYKLFTRYVDDFIRSIGNPTQRFKTLGEAVQSSVESLRKQRLGFTDYTTGLKVSGVSDTLFGDAFRIANSRFPVKVLPSGSVEALVSMKNVKDTAIELADNLSGMNTAAPKLFKIAKGTDDVVGLSEFLDLRSDLMQLAKSKGVIGTRANRLATIMVGKMDNELRLQAQQHGVANTFLPALEKARRYYERAARLFNEGVVARVAQQSPTEVSRTLMTMDRAEDVRNVKLILTRTDPELWKKVQASYVDFALKVKPGVFSRAGEAKSPIVQPNKLAAWWNKMLPEVKQSMFTAEQRRAIDKIVLVGSEVPIGNVPQGWAGRTIAMSKTASIATHLGIGALGFFGGQMATHGSPVMSGLIGLGALWVLPKTAAKMALSKEGRALLGEGLALSKLQLTGKVVNTAKYMSRLGIYLARPEYETDIEETRKRVRAGFMLSAGGYQATEQKIDEFLEKNPNFK